MSNLQASINYAHDHQNHFLETLKELLRIPSVSTDPEMKPAIQKAAYWVAAYLIKLGIEKVQVIPTNGHPIVYGEYLKSGKDKPTVLVYGHYDVQPAEPLELWTTGAFEPTIRENALFARGASDMKGQVMASLFAIESVMSQGQCPVNLKFLIEGEEEIGSPSLASFLEKNIEMLKSTVALNTDTGMIAEDVPTIAYGLRGLAFFEIRVYGPERDLHSGVFGGVVENPANALCKLVGEMHDEHGKITLPGFYDKVASLSEEERKQLARLPMDDDGYLRQTGSPAVWGEPGFTSTERIGARPTLDVNGMFSGFTGKGSKTIIPSWAMAKISMRLVPNQDPEEVYGQLNSYMKQNAPKTIRWEIIKMNGSPACFTDRESPATQALAKSLEEVWGKKPVFKREGGSVPIVSDMQKILNIQSVLTGFGLPNDNIHAPNEKLHLPTWFRGIDALIHFFYYL
jgi:acetylornithine deacetylase/succinyl-diaminopimelate desuccinylase-like protein